MSFSQDLKYVDYWHSGEYKNAEDDLFKFSMFYNIKSGMTIIRIEFKTNKNIINNTIFQICISYKQEKPSNVFRKLSNGEFEITLSENGIGTGIMINNRIYNLQSMEIKNKKPSEGIKLEDVKQNEGN